MSFTNQITNNQIWELWFYHGLFDLPPLIDLILTVVVTLFVMAYVSYYIIKWKRQWIGSRRSWRVFLASFFTFMIAIAFCIPVLKLVFGWPN